MILLIDNYDSFTYNLAQLIESFGETVQVIQNDTNINLDEFLPEKIIISPGPGTPSESGISNCGSMPPLNLTSASASCVPSK